MASSSWRNLSEMDLVFARSRRRALSRRRIPPKRRPAAWRSVRAAILALVLLTVIAESTRLESSNAKPTARPAVAPTLDPACPVPARFRSAFAAAAAKTGVPASVLVATAYEESHMDPAAESGAGAKGLLQLMPATARELHLAGNDPATNVLAGARYLRQMINRFGSIDLALAAYNAGPTAVERAGAAPTEGTLRYVKNIEARARLLVACG